VETVCVLRCSFFRWCGDRHLFSVFCSCYCFTSFPCACFCVCSYIFLYNCYFSVAYAACIMYM